MCLKFFFLGIVSNKTKQYHYIAWKDFYPWTHVLEPPRTASTSSKPCCGVNWPLALAKASLRRMWPITCASTIGVLDKSDEMWTWMLRKRVYTYREAFKNKSSKTQNKQPIPPPNKTPLHTEALNSWTYSSFFFIFHGYHGFSAVKMLGHFPSNHFRKLSLSYLTWQHEISQKKTQNSTSCNCPSYCTNYIHIICTTNQISTSWRIPSFFEEILCRGLPTSALQLFRAPLSDSLRGRDPEPRGERWHASGEHVIVEVPAADEVPWTCTQKRTGNRLNWLFYEQTWVVFVCRLWNGGTFVQVIGMN